MTTIRHVRLYLTVRTPVHVGAAHHLSPGMYSVSGWDQGTVTVFSERKLIAWLYERRLAVAFVACMDRQPAPDVVRGGGGSAPQSPVHAFLEQYAPRSVPMERLAAYTVPWHGWRYEHRLHRPTGSLRPFLRDGRYQVLIPGSSVRGALRTAIFGSWLLGSTEDLAKVERFTREQVESQQRQRAAGGDRSDRRHRYPATELEIDFFSRLQWCEEERRKIEPPHRDVLRALKVADVTDTTAVRVAVYPVVSWSLRADGAEYAKHTHWVECIEPGSRFTVDVSFDPAVLQRGIRDPRVLPPVPIDGDALVATLTRWAEAVWSAEGEAARHYPAQAPHLASLHRFYAGGEPAGLRMGSGSGWLGLTLGAVLPPELRRSIGAAYFRRDRQTVFPKSRRLAVLPSGEHVPMGWLDIEHVEPVRRP